MSDEAGKTVKELKILRDEYYTGRSKKNCFSH